MRSVGVSEIRVRNTILQPVPFCPSLTRRPAIADLSDADVLTNLNQSPKWRLELSVIIRSHKELRLLFFLVFFLGMDKVKIWLPTPWNGEA